MEKWLRILNELTSPRITPRLEHRIHQEILVKGEEYTHEKADAYSTGIELMGKLIMAHHNYTEKHGAFGDMFGDYLALDGSLNPRCGQFLTPIHIAEFIAKMTLGDKLPDKTQRILDPASGTGRFMLMTAKHYASTTGKLNFIFFNIDIGFSVYVYCTMNAILNGIPSVNVWGDSLKMEYTEAVATIPIGKVVMWKMLNKEGINSIMPQPPPKAPTLRDFT